MFDYRIRKRHKSSNRSMYWSLLFCWRRFQEVWRVYLIMAQNRKTEIPFCYIWSLHKTHINLFIKTFPLAFLSVPLRCKIRCFSYKLYLLSSLISFFPGSCLQGGVIQVIGFPSLCLCVVATDHSGAERRGRRRGEMNEEKDGRRVHASHQAHSTGQNTRWCHFRVAWRST